MSKQQFSRRAFLAATTSSAAGLSLAGQAQPNTARVVPKKNLPQ